jgi:hypothetical protein
MEASQKVLRGVAHGNIIALFDDTGLPDGEIVSVVVTKTEMTPEEQRHPELVKLFGVWAGEAKEVDEFVKQTYEDRKSDVRPDLEP